MHVDPEKNQPLFPFTQHKCDRKKGRMRKSKKKRQIGINQKKMHKHIKLHEPEETHTRGKKEEEEGTHK